MDIYQIIIIFIAFLQCCILWRGYFTHEFLQKTLDLVESRLDRMIERGEILSNYGLISEKFEEFGTYKNFFKILFSLKRITLENYFSKEQIDWLLKD